MAKLNTIELDKSVSDIVSKVFKIGGSADKIASSVINAMITKMVFGNQEEQRNIISSLVPDVLSAADAMKIYNNIQKYKQNEKEKLFLFMQQLEESENKENSKPKSTLSEKREEKKVNSNIESHTTKSLAIDEDL